MVLAERTTAVGLFNFGLSYLHCAEMALQSEEKLAFSHPIYFLCGQGLELMFKADMKRKMSIEHVRKCYGHDIAKLRADLSEDFKAAINISSEMDNTINFLAGLHGNPYLDRYIVTGVMQALEPGLVVKSLMPLRKISRAKISELFL